MTTDKMLEKKAEALRSQVLRKLGLKELPAKVTPDWIGLVNMVERIGTGAVDAAVESIQVAMECPNEVNPN